MKLEIIKPFGPSIVKLKIPNDIVIEMNRYTDDIIKDKSKSKSLDFYLFPAYLLHTVYPFTDSDDERRSVSFNAAIDSSAASL